MMLTDILQVGNKVDICPIEKADVRRAEEGRVPILASRLESVDDNGELIIQMPTDKGRIYLLSLGSRYELMFYARGGLYRAVCQAVDRYKEGGLFMAKLVLKSGISKFQRREYFRLQCILGMEAFELSRDDALRLNTEQLEERLKDPLEIMTEEQAVIVDISGGGIRFITERQHETGDYLAVRTHLKNEAIDQPLLVVVTIVSCRKADNMKDRYETRAEFLHLGSKLRETIVKYIFDEDRKMAKRM